MRRGAAILFLSLFALLFAGVHIYFVSRLFAIKKEMRAALQAMPEDQLTLLVLEEDRFNDSRVEEGEIKLNGKMYDIARYEMVNGCVTVWCLHDEAEDNLLSFLDAVLRNLHQDTAPVPISMAFFTLLWDLPMEIDLPINRVAIKQSLLTAYSDSLHAPILSLESPPPRA